jgi:hypothetical protein
MDDGMRRRSSSTDRRQLPYAFARSRGNEAGFEKSSPRDINVGMPSRPIAYDLEIGGTEMP